MTVLVRVDGNMVITIIANGTGNVVNCRAIGKIVIVMKGIIIIGVIIIVIIIIIIVSVIIVIIIIIIQLVL